MMTIILNSTGATGAETNLLQQRIVTPKGLKAVLWQDSRIPMISLTFRYKGQGVGQNTIQGEGVMLSQLWLEGHTSKAPIELHKALSELSIKISLSAEGEDIVGTLETLNRHKDFAFSTLKELLNFSDYSDETLARVREKIAMYRARNEESAGQLAFNRLKNIVYKDMPQGWDSYGTEASLLKITNEHIRKRKLAWTPDVLSIAVAGDISVSELSQRLEDVFFYKKASDIANSRTADEENNKLVFGKQEHISFAQPQAIFITAQPTLAISDKDYFAARILMHILGGDEHARLMQKLRQEKGWVYGVSAWMQGEKYPLAMIYGTTQVDKLQQSLEIIEAEKAKIANNGVTLQELEQVKKALAGEYSIQFTDLGTISSALAWYEQMRLPIDYMQTRNDKLNKVSLKQVNELAKTIWEEPTTIVTIGP